MKIIVKFFDVWIMSFLFFNSESSMMIDEIRFHNQKYLQVFRRSEKDNIVILE